MGLSLSVQIKPIPEGIHRRVTHWNCQLRTIHHATRSAVCYSEFAICDAKHPNILQFNLCRDDFVDQFLLGIP